METFCKEVSVNRKAPLCLLAHKKRNEWLDQNLLKAFTDVGFDGKQIQPDEMNQQFIDPQINVYKFVYLGKNDTN